MEIAEQRALLTKLVSERYGHRGATLQPISPYIFEDRGIYRVNCEDGTYVLRAFLFDAEAFLIGHAAVLDYLQTFDFPAPRAYRTRDGEILARYEGWTALLVSFIQGEDADFTPDKLERLAEYVGWLHNRTSSIVMDVAGTTLSDSSRRPTHCAGQAIERLRRASVDAPEELRGFYADTIATLQRIWQAHREGLLPEVLIHGDCWPGNAVLTGRDEIAMIDWDCAGVGPAILDVGYLLLTCHLGKPQLPAMQPDEERIAAVVRGYRRVRELSSAERSVLKEAILYDVARRTGLDIVSSGIVETWREDIRWQKMLARYAVSAPIAEIAGKYFAE